MGNKSANKEDKKKQGSTIKEKRAAKKAKVAEKSTSRIPTTGR